MTAAHGQIRIASPTLHATVFVSIAVFLAIVAMSIAFRIEVVARGKGRVVPIGRVQVVQPELSGRVNAIHVRNGMTVEKGQVLIVLDSTDAQVQLGTIAAERDRLRIEMIRIDTLVDVLDRISSGTVASLWNADDLDLPEDLRDHPFALAQAELLRSEIGDLRASLEQIDARTEASLKSEAVTNANAERIVAALTIQRQRMDTAEKLLASGTTSRSSFLDVEQTLLELERQRDVYLREADQKQAERRALGIERRQLLANLRSGLLTRKAEIEARLALLAQEMRGAQRRLDASTLRAPVSGIVDQLKTFTIGGVVTAEAELMRIVPTNIAIEVEGVFSNQDVGFLEVGQKANIRLDSYPSERFGFVEGRVIDIAADSTEIADGQWGYVVRVSPSRVYLQAGTDRLSLKPGMTATIDVITDKRRIISYFFAPIVRTFQDAMGER